MEATVPADIVFGPVPSRRLGRSLGINHIPPKTCSYACVYCQLGRTSPMQITRQAFYKPKSVIAAVQEKVAASAASSEAIDYLTLVPDGEPTLDLGLEDLLTALETFGIPKAVITNASLLSQAPVRAALLHADWVSLKMDAADTATWRRIDRPHRRLRLQEIRAGARAFARAFHGTLVTETMVVAGVNDDPGTLTTTAAAIEELHPSVAYLGIPTRPPAESWVQAPDEAALNRAYQIFAAALPNVELLIGYEGNAFAATGDPAADLLSISAVHPMREDAVRALLARTGAGWELAQDLLAQGLWRSTVYAGQTFYLRNLSPELIP